MTTLMCKWHVDASCLEANAFQGTSFDNLQDTFNYIDALTEGYKCNKQAKDILVTLVRSNNKFYIRIADMTGTPIGYLQNRYPDSGIAQKTNTVLNTAVDSNTESNTEKVQANENVSEISDCASIEETNVNKSIIDPEKIGG